jgi:ABC-2 type transport system permease protein
MRNVPTILKRELIAYFLSPLAYIVTLVLLVVMGVTFTGIVAIVRHEPQSVPIMQILFFWLFFVVTLTLPIITMRLYAEEKGSGTLEVLMTAPVTDAEVVVGKYLGALFFYVGMWAPTFLYVFILRWFSRETTPLDMGPIWAGYLGILLVGMLLLAIGFLCSALTNSQVVAAIVAFVVSFVFFILLPLFGSTWANRELVSYFSPMHHVYGEFARGWVDVRRIVLYLSATVWVLFLTEKVIESRKWK